MACVIIIAVLINMVVPLIRGRRYFLIAVMSVLTVLYIIWVFNITVFSRTENTALSVKLVPFSSFLSMRHNPWFGWGEYIAMGILGNALLLAPLGMYLENFIRLKRVWLIAGICAFLLSLCIEVAQLVFSLGVFEVDDLICNTWGCVMGVCIIRFIEEILPPKRADLLKCVQLLLPVIVFVVLLGVASLISLLICI